MHYARLIVNPSARSGETAGEWPLISELLKHNNFDFDYVFTESTGHGIELAKEAAQKGCDLVVAVGGDGTVNEVVNGIVDENGRGGAALGVICTGTGSDFIRTLGIPRDYGKAVATLVGNRRTDIDIGRVEYTGNGVRLKRYYINVAGLGFDAAVVERTTRLKRLGGTVPFLLGFSAVLATYRARKVEMKIDGRMHRESSLLIAVSNGRYFGGGMKIAPDADPCDGLLDLITVHDTNKIRLLYNFPRIYKGTHTAHPKVNVFRAMSIEVESAQRLPLQLDGELVGEAPASFTIIPGAISIVSGGLHG